MSKASFVWGWALGLLATLMLALIILVGNGMSGGQALSTAQMLEAIRAGNLGEVFYALYSLVRVVPADFIQRRNVFYLREVL